MSEAKNINRSTYGQYGLTTIDGFEVPYLSASRADELVGPTGTFYDFSHSKGNLSKDLGWSGNSYSNKLLKGAAALGVEAVPMAFEPYFDTNDVQYRGQKLTGTPKEPMGFYYFGLDEAAQKFGLDKSQFTPYEKEIEGERVIDPESGVKEKGVIIKGEPEAGIPDRPATRIVTAEEQMFDRLNELSKDFYLYTGDSLIPGQAQEGSPNAFQTVLYKKEGDVLKPITAPQVHGGMQNRDVYTGGSGFKLDELLRGIAPVAALAIGGPLLDAALAGGAAAGGAAGGTAAGTGLTGGAGGSTGLLTGTGAAGFGGAGSASGIAATQAAAGLGVATGSALPAVGMATGGFPSTVGQLSAALPAQGSVGGAGLLSAELAPGTILGSGLPGGGAIGASYALGANGLPATNLLGQPIAASSIGFGDIPATVTSGLSIGIKDALDVARLGKGLLGGGAQPTQQPAMQKPQSIRPQGQVDYSGIINLLQTPSPQRNMYSLLG